MPKKNSCKLLFWLFLAFILTGTTLHNGCSSARRAAAIIPATKTRPAEFLVGKLREHGANGMPFLSARARVYSETEGSGLETFVNITWYRDSVIWLNVRKFGIEAARALIRPDSAFILYRITQTYSIVSIRELQREYNLPGGFPLIQNFLLGTAWLPEGQAFQSGIRDSMHRLSAALPSYTMDYRIDEGRFLLQKALFLQPQEKRTLSLDYERYEKLDGFGFFPYLRRLESYSPENGSFRLEFELLDIDVHEAKPYRFEIPAHYTREK